MKYTPKELAERIREGGRLGAARTAEIRKAKRERYRTGQMSVQELAEYENYCAQRRRAGASGGKNSARRRLERAQEVSGE